LKTNTIGTRKPRATGHAGAAAKNINAFQVLQRTVLACMLWEDSFYEDGASVADRIKDLVPQVPAEDVATLAVRARTEMKLRHVPLLLARELARNKYNVATLLPQIINRPDELGEFLTLYWKDGRTPIAASVKRGLAAAFTKFNEYSLAKYNRDVGIKLRDVLFLVHPKPKDAEQDAVWKRLVEGKLVTPDTWETALSGGEDKTAAWTRLLTEKKLPALALLRNLRNMDEAKVDKALIKTALGECNPEWVLPFRFISAAKYAPTLEPELETLMFKCLEGRPKLKGRTTLLVDGSGSMFDAPISVKSDITRFEGACALAMLLREVCEDVSIICFGKNAQAVAPRRGFALRDALRNAPVDRGRTMTETAKQLADTEAYDRIIILTDEQSHQVLSNPKAKGYVINVAIYQHGIGYGHWTHIDGWSEAVVDFIQTVEEEKAFNAEEVLDKALHAAAAVDA
jgi:60 kDa SS-A/Ro ribonucleoprotein